MQTCSGSLLSVQDTEGGHCSQKTAQSKGVWSLLASAKSTGMMPSTSLQGLVNAGSQDSDASSACKSGGENHAPAGCAVWLGHDSYADHCCTGKSIHVRKARCRPEKYSSSRRNVALFFGLCSVILCGFCVHLQLEVRDQNEKFQTIQKNYQAVSDDMERLSAEFHKMITKNNPNPISESDDPTMHSSAAPMQLWSGGFPAKVSRDFHTRRKRSMSAHDRRRYIRTTVVNYLREMPKVHLKGLNNTHGSENRENSYLVWQPDSDSPESFEPRGVSFVHVYNDPHRIKGIIVQQTGIYVVYSQVVVNGSRNSTWRRDCAHQTVITRQYAASSSPRVLLSGFVTQDSEGRYENHSIPYPRDSSLQMGIFKLIRQTEVRVRMPAGDGCRLTLITNDLKTSYFGLYRIS